VRGSVHCQADAPSKASPTCLRSCSTATRFPNSWASPTVVLKDYPTPSLHNRLHPRPPQQAAMPKTNNYLSLFSFPLHLTAPVVVSSLIFPVLAFQRFNALTFQRPHRLTTSDARVLPDLPQISHPTASRSSHLPHNDPSERCSRSPSQPASHPGLPATPHAPPLPDLHRH